MTIFTKTMPSPVGVLKLVASDTGLVALLWENDRPRRAKLGVPIEDNGHPMLCRAEAQIEQYFAGRRTSFDLDLDTAGTGFQQTVWTALCAIPFGQSRTYGTLARDVGAPLASRAVGAACGRNPISIIVPCHRAIGSTGALRGFAGGQETKRFLLDFEARSIETAAQRAVQHRMLSNVV